MLLNYNVPKDSKYNILENSWIHGGWFVSESEVVLFPYPTLFLPFFFSWGPLHILATVIDSLINSLEKVAGTKKLRP